MSTTTRYFVLLQPADKAKPLPLVAKANTIGAGRHPNIMAENKASTPHDDGVGRRTMRSSLIDHIETVNEATNKSAKEKMRVHLASSSLAQLNTTDLRLHGREGDMEMLMGKLKSINNLEKELIMVVGSSGCGKSSLVMRGAV